MTRSFRGYMSGGTKLKGNNRLETTCVAASGGSTVYLDICEVYTLYACRIYILYFTAEGGVDINQSPKRSKTRNTPHQTLSTSPRSLSSGYFYHSPFVMHSFSKGKKHQKMEKEREENKTKTTETKKP